MAAKSTSSAFPSWTCYVAYGRRSYNVVDYITILTFLAEIGQIFTGIGAWKLEKNNNGMLLPIHA